MLLDVNWQHFLDSLSDKKLNRNELVSALASKVTFSGQGYYTFIQYFLMCCCISSVCGGKHGFFFLFVPELPTWHLILFEFCGISCVCHNMKMYGFQETAWIESVLQCSIWCAITTLESHVFDPLFVLRAPEASSSPLQLKDDPSHSFLWDDFLVRLSLSIDCTCLAFPEGSDTAGGFSSAIRAKV